MKNRTLVIYKSKTGFTERYAQWICDELGGDKVAYKERKTICFDNYDTVIFGSSFHAGMISGVKWFKGKMKELERKTTIVFATGATPSNAPDIQKALRQNFSEEEWNKIKVYYMQSGLCYEKMGLGAKLMMAVFRKMLKKTEGESEAYKMVQHSYDHASKEFILPLVEYYNSKDRQS